MKKRIVLILLLVLQALISMATFGGCNKLSKEKCLGDFRRTYEISSAVPALGISAVTVSETYRFLADGTGLMYEGLFEQKEIIFYYTYTIDDDFNVIVTISEVKNDNYKVGDQIPMNFELEEKEVILYQEYISYNKVTA